MSYDVQVAPAALRQLPKFPPGASWRIHAASPEPARAPGGIAERRSRALLGSNGPMTILEITDPRPRSPMGWASDLVPHLAYGIVTGAALQALDRGPPGTP